MQMHCSPKQTSSAHADKTMEYSPGRSWCDDIPTETHLDLLLRRLHHQRTVTLDTACWADHKCMFRWTRPCKTAAGCTELYKHLFNKMHGRAGKSLSCIRHQHADCLACHAKRIVWLKWRSHLHCLLVHLHSQTRQAVSCMAIHWVGNDWTRPAFSRWHACLAFSLLAETVALQQAHLHRSLILMRLHGQFRVVIRP